MRLFAYGYHVIRGKAAFWLCSLSFIAVGAVLLLAASARKDDSRRTAVGTGTIVSVRREYDSQKKVAYHFPTVRFRTSQGRSVEFRSWGGSPDPGYVPGAAVEVAYDPADPANAGLRSDRDAVRMLDILGAALAALGGLVFAGLLASLVVAARSPQNQRAWYWWINFLCGMLGAALFALPAAAMLPLFYLCPDSRSLLGEDVALSLLFTLIGVAALAGLCFLGRAQYRDRPR